MAQILETLNLFRDRLKGLVVESTFNWYWPVDCLIDAGYHDVHLANPSAIKQYEGLKYSDDQHDAFFPAQLLILGILPKDTSIPETNARCATWHVSGCFWFDIEPRINSACKHWYGAAVLIMSMPMRWEH